jgi:hypothetical protein
MQHPGLLPAPNHIIPKLPDGQLAAPPQITPRLLPLEPDADPLPPLLPELALPQHPPNLFQIAFQLRLGGLEGAAFEALLEGGELPDLGQGLGPAEGVGLVQVRFEVEELVELVRGAGRGQLPFGVGQAL